MATATHKPGILRNLTIKRVSLVENGANQDTVTRDGAHIMLFKAGPSVGAVHVDAPIGKCGSDCPGCSECSPTDADTDYEKANLTAESRSSLPDSAFAAVWTDAKGQKHRKLPIHDAGHLAAARGRIDGANIPSDVKAAARHKIDEQSSKEKPVAKTITLKTLFKSIAAALGEKDETKRAELISEIEKDAEMAMAAPPNAAPPPAANPMEAHLKTLKAMIDSHGPGPHPEGHPVHALKAVCDALGPASTEPTTGADEPGKLGGAVSKAHVEKMEALEKSNKELATSLAIEKGVRLDGEMREVLKGFKATPFVMEGENNDITRFRKMKEADPEGYERTMVLLKATDAQLATSHLFGKQVGSSRTGTGSAWDQISAKADALVEKSTTNLSHEAAIEKVMLDNPKLVEQYRAEQQ